MNKLLVTLLFSAVIAVAFAQQQNQDLQQLQQQYQQHQLQQQQQAQQLAQQQNSGLMELFKQAGVQPVTYTRYGTPVFDPAKLNQLIQEKKYACTSGSCCDIEKGKMKDYGSACTLDPSKPCMRPAGFCLGASADCRMDLMEDGTICPGGTCQNGECVIEDCDAECCKDGKIALPKGTACSNGKCELGKCVPNNVVVLQSNFLSNKNLTKPDTVTAANEFDGDAYNTQTADEEDTMSDFDQKIMRRIDGVLDKYNEKKNGDLKMILKGISDKERRRKDSQKAEETRRAKKEAAYKKEVQAEKERYEALEKLDQKSA